MALNELHHLIIADEFVVSRNHDRIPDGMQLVDRDAWRKACRRKGLSEGDEESEKRAFRRAVNQLSGAGLVGAYSTYVWPIPGQGRTTSGEV